MAIDLGPVGAMGHARFCGGPPGMSALFVDENAVRKRSVGPSLAADCAPS